MTEMCRPKRPTRTERSRQRIDERRRRLAAALRENLKRRKAQAQTRLDPEGDLTGDDDEPGGAQH